MGNSHLTGHLLNLCGCTDILGHETTAQALIQIHGIEAWNARGLIYESLRRQRELASRSPLRKIPVAEGLYYVNRTVSAGLFPGRLTRDKFVQVCTDLLVVRGIRATLRERDELHDIFGSMDYDGNGWLSLGEWAGGLSIFFTGTQEECVHAVFTVLDRDGSRSLSEPELQEYLEPYVTAMSPPEAASLRPLLLKRATATVFKEMDLDRHDDISSEEMLEWTRRGNNIIDRLAAIIDQSTSHICQDEMRERSAQLVPGGGYSLEAPLGPGTGYGNQQPLTINIQVSGPPGSQGVSVGGRQYGGGYGGAPPVSVNVQYAGASRQR